MPPSPELASLSRRFERFARLECQDSSPLYEHLSLRIAEDPDLLALATHAGRRQPAPNLFLAAVHWLLLQGVEHPAAAFYLSLSPAPAPDEDPYPHFRELCLEHGREIARLMSVRLVQTNVVRRSACLLPAFGLVSRQYSSVPKPLSLVEVGAGAGLNLLWDRYGYHYGRGHSWGGANSPVQITCEARGPHLPPIPPALPQAVFRVGLDLNPIDVHDPEATQWLRALIWPEHQDRVDLLERAISLARQDPPWLVAGDALELLPRTLAEAPQDSALCVFHSHTLNQFSPEARERFSSIIARHAESRDLSLVSMESHQQGHSLLKLVSYVNGEQIEQCLAYCDPHGRWIQWLGDGRVHWSIS